MKKEEYVSPTVEIIALESEGFLASSNVIWVDVVPSNGGFDYD